MYEDKMPSLYQRQAVATVANELTAIDKLSTIFFTLGRGNAYQISAGSRTAAKTASSSRTGNVPTSSITAISIYSTSGFHTSSQRCSFPYIGKFKYVTWVRRREKLLTR